MKFSKLPQLVGLLELIVICFYEITVKWENYAYMIWSNTALTFRSMWTDFFPTLNDNRHNSTVPFVSVWRILAFHPMLQVDKLELVQSFSFTLAWSSWTYAMGNYGMEMTLMKAWKYCEYGIIMSIFFFLSFFFFLFLFFVFLFSFFSFEVKMFTILQNSENLDMFAWLRRFIGGVFERLQKYWSGIGVVRERGEREGASEYRGKHVKANTHLHQRACKHTRTREYTHTHTHTHTHARTHTNTHTHTLTHALTHASTHTNTSTHTSTHTNTSTPLTH